MQVRRRMEQISNVVLGCCVDSKLVKEHPRGYLKSNRDLALEVVNFIDVMKCRH